MNKINHVILCIIDDVRSTQFFEMIQNGFLPNFKKMMENGIYSENCITDFPSITFPTQVSIITGTYTGDYRNELCHGVPCYNWMGRDTYPPHLRNYGSNRLDIYKMNQDLGMNCKTLFEMVGDGNKASITQFINRGVDYFFPESRLKLALYYLLIKYYRNVRKIIARANSIVVQRVLDTFQNPKKYFDVKEAPIGSLLWFMTSDVILHMYGSDHLFYKLNLMHIDKVMGILLKELKKMGYLDETAIAITADHGNYKAKRVAQLKPYLNHFGLNQFNPRKNYKGNVDVAEFGGVGFFSFKGRTNSSQNSKNYKWNLPNRDELEHFGPKNINLLQKLFKIDGVKLMYFQDSENTHKRGKIYLKKKLNNGNIIKGLLEYQGSGKEMKTRYSSENSEYDIFDYKKCKDGYELCDEKYRTLNEWLDLTHNVDYPLYPDLLCRHFKNPRSSDIVLSTQGEVVFNIEHGKKKGDIMYKHDIGLRESTIVPLIISGSKKIPKKEVKYCKTVDIVPTLLEMIGRSPFKENIGEILY
ncbi:MAG: hypothetical protein GF317_17035 [Candidatus Lokiarchaeota archaeon]|nr:hypothetical protein [Candidatus Lokiarchaeota archaeon]MBD3201224.1 hypothetical protein [Candidatus Lokiarchaeota archaeon]